MANKFKNGSIAYTTTINSQHNDHVMSIVKVLIFGKSLGTEDKYKVIGPYCSDRQKMDDITMHTIHESMLFTTPKKAADWIAQESAIRAFNEFTHMENSKFGASDIPIIQSNVQFWAGDIVEATRPNSVPITCTVRGIWGCSITDGVTYELITEMGSRINVNEKYLTKL